MLNDKIHNDFVVTNDKTFAAALWAAGHRPLTLFREVDGQFYCIFAIRRKLRKDIRAYYADALRISVLQLRESLIEIEENLGNNEWCVYDKFRNSFAHSDER